MSDQQPRPDHRGNDDNRGRPPLGSWRRMYALVLGNLALMILLLYIFTRTFD